MAMVVSASISTKHIVMATHCSHITNPFIDKLSFSYMRRVKSKKLEPTAFPRPEQLAMGKKHTREAVPNQHPVIPRRRILMRCSTRADNRPFPVQVPAPRTWYPPPRTRSPPPRTGYPPTRTGYPLPSIRSFTERKTTKPYTTVFCLSRTSLQNYRPIYCPKQKH